MLNLTKDFADFKDGLIKLSQSGNIQAFNKKVVENMASVYVREAKLNTPVGKRSVKFMQHGKIQTKYFDSEHTRQSWSVGRYQLNEAGESRCLTHPLTPRFLMMAIGKKLGDFFRG